MIRQERTKRGGPDYFGGRLNELRLAAGLSQPELAERVGIRTRTILKWERGICLPDWPNVIALADALGVPCEAFRGRPKPVAAPNSPRRGCPFASRLRELRKQRRWTQRDLAGRAGVGLVTIQCLERGSQRPTWETALALADGLGVGCDAFRWTDRIQPVFNPVSVPSSVFGCRLTDHRERSNLSQAKLAEKIGVVPSVIAGWERGRNEPNWGNVLALSTVLGVSAAAFQPQPAADAEPSLPTSVGHFGRRLKELRLAADLTQAALAVCSGLPQSTVANIEIGRNKAYWRTVLAFADALGVPSEVFREHPRPHEVQPCMSVPASEAQFGTRLHEFRGKAGWTQRELAQRAGIVPDAVWLLEGGKRKPKWTTVQALADALGISSEDFRRPAAKGRATVNIRAATRFGSRLRELRERSGFSKAELAQLAGVPQKFISSWEQGKDTPRRLPGSTDEAKMRPPSAPRKPINPPDPNICFVLPFPEDRDLGSFLQPTGNLCTMRGVGVHSSCNPPLSNHRYPQPP